MPESKTLNDLFIDELRDAYDAEKQLTKALRKMAGAAMHPDLSEAFKTHLEETNGQIATLEEVFALLDMKPKGKHCPGIAGIIEEGSEPMEEMDKSPVLDAALIGSGKRAEHYEMAAYATLIALANQLGMDEAVDKFQQILDQEVAADQKLSTLAEALLPLAAGESDDDEQESDDNADDDEEESPAPASRAKPAAKKAAPAAKKAPAKRGSR